MGLYMPISKYFKSFSAETDVRRQILTSIVRPSAEGLKKYFFVLLLDHMCQTVLFGTTCAYVDTFKQCHGLK